MPAKVTDVARALSKLPSDQLLASYSAREMERRNVYGVSGDGEDSEYIRHHYERLRSYYADAARTLSGMLIYIG